ncbi:hypothetical protein [Flavobacterium sp. I3-2]|uniref:COG1470 family protein n=1 Tax=Flavobacterium sp. I3-2 TaxID=2748319 RepID=UPI0015ADC50D|nr:hypothetical protein [Flavobacterium sp. I3-2]
MNKTIILVLFFILPNFFYGQDLIVDFVNQDQNLSPSNVHTLVFRITNPLQSEILLTPSIKIPENWTLSTKFTSINLAANETKICLITIQIPSFASTGSHDFDLSFINQNEYVLFSKTYFLDIKQIKKVTLAPVEISDYVKAGDTIKGSFVLRNEGNEMEEIFIEPTKGTFLLQENPIVLLPGKSIIINTFQPTDSKQPKPSIEITKLIASSANDLQKTVFATQRTDVIPLFQVNEDVWLRFPIKISGTFLGAQRFNGFETGFQGEIHAKGSLNEKNSNFLEFKAVGPDRFSLTTFSQYEEYFVNYESQNFYVHLGDKVFTSSLLTEFFRFGRGVEIKKKFNKFEVGGFYNKPRFNQNISDEINVYSKVNFNPNTHLRFGYLLKRNEMRDETHLYFISGKGKLFKKVEIESEYALSNSQNANRNAFQIQASAYFNKLSVNMNYVYSAPQFSGYYSNSEFYTANLNYQIFSKLNLSMNYQKDARNFERDTLYGVAPFRENFQMGLRYNYIKKGTISLFSGVQEYEDRMKIKQFFYNENFYRVELFQEINRFTINLQSFFGKTTNFLINSSGKSTLYTANVGYVKNSFSVNLNAGYSILDRYETKGEKMFLFGGRLNAFISNKWETSLFYQNTYYREDNFADRNLFETFVNHKLTSKQQVHLIARYALARNQIQNNDFSFSLKYILNINAPFKKIKEYGTLEGNISNLGNSKIEGIRILLGTYIAITDAKGYFIFKDVNPDDYFLEMDYSTLNINDITEVSLPMKISISEGKNYFDFGITQAAKIKGSINLETTNEDQGQSIIVELTSETETYRKICDITKPFDFTYLKPGDWTLKIYRNGLDKKFIILTDNLNFTLHPNEEKEIEIKISKKEKEVQFLQQSMKVGVTNSKK